MAYRGISATPGNFGTGTGTSVTSHPITYPSGTGGGILWLHGLNTPGTVTAPASPWVQLEQDIAGGSDVLIVCWLPPGNTESAVNITCTTACRSAGWTWRIDGSDSWTPEHAGTNSSSVNPDSPSLTPSWNSGGASDTVWASFEVNRNASSTTVSSFPASYALQTGYDSTTGAAAGVGVGYAFRQQNTTAAEDPGAFTLSVSRNWAAVTIGIKPVAGGDTTPPAVPTGLTLGTLVQES